MHLKCTQAAFTLIGLFIAIAVERSSVRCTTTWIVVFELQRCMIRRVYITTAATSHAIRMQSSAKCLVL
jgi:hypothetical protein